MSTLARSFGLWEILGEIERLEASVDSLIEQVRSTPDGPSKSELKSRCCEILDQMRMEWEQIDRMVGEHGKWVQRILEFRSKLAENQ